MMAGRSSNVYVDPCDEDIDLLSELLNDTDDHGSADAFGLSGDMLSSDVDDLTSYLSGSTRSELITEAVPAEVISDPCPLSPTLTDSPMASGYQSPVHTPVSSVTVIKKHLHADMKSSVTNKIIKRSLLDIQSPPLSKQHELRSTHIDNISTEVQVGHQYEHTVDKAEAAFSKSVIVVVPKSKPSMNKTAISARENRVRKKKYVENLETDMKDLKEENTGLKRKVDDQDEMIKRLNEEVKYLRSIIANQSTLSALLQNIHNTGGVKLKTSWSAKGNGVLSANKNREDNSENKNRQRLKSKPKTTRPLSRKTTRPKSRQEVALVPRKRT